MSFKGLTIKDLEGKPGIESIEVGSVSAVKPHPELPPLPPPTPKGHGKYRSCRVYQSADGVMFTKNRQGIPISVNGLPIPMPQKPWRKVADSKKEYRRLVELMALEARGAIKNLQTQKAYQLVIGGVLIESYVADFVYEENGETIVEDAKGMRTKDYIRKRKWMKSVHGITIRET